MVDCNLKIMEALFRVLRLTNKETFPSTGNYISTLKKIGANSTYTHRCETPLERLLEHQWLEKWVTSRNMHNLVSVLNKSLHNRTFLVSNQITICDILWALSMKDVMEKNMTFTDKEDNAHLTRWYSHVTSHMNISTLAVKSKTLLYS